MEHEAPSSPARGRATPGQGPVDRLRDDGNTAGAVGSAPGAAALGSPSRPPPVQVTRQQSMTIHDEILIAPSSGSYSGDNTPLHGPDTPPRQASPLSEHAGRVEHAGSGGARVRDPANARAKGQRIIRAPRMGEVFRRSIGRLSLDVTEPYAHQVGGSRVIVRCKAGTVFKPCSDREAWFYEEMVKPLNTHCIQGLTPAYYGSRVLTGTEPRDNGHAVQDACSSRGSGSSEGEGGPAGARDAASDKADSVSGVVLEDLTQGFTCPCVLDIKMGVCTAAPDRTEEKRQSAEDKDKITTTGSIGARVCGLRSYQVLCPHRLRWDDCDQCSAIAHTNHFTQHDKHWGKSLDLSQFALAVESFFNNGERVRRRVAGRMLEDLARVARFIATSRFRFYASSVLLIYEGAEGLEPQDKADDTDGAHQAVEHHLVPQEPRPLGRRLSNVSGQAGAASTVDSGGPCQSPELEALHLLHDDDAKITVVSACVSLQKIDPSAAGRASFACGCVCGLPRADEAGQPRVAGLTDSTGSRT